MFAEALIFVACGMVWNGVRLFHGRRLLPARSFAKLLELAEIQPDDSILDIGCGTGYSTAVIARLGSRVTGLEEDATLEDVDDFFMPLKATGVISNPLSGKSTEQLNVEAR